MHPKAKKQFLLVHVGILLLVLLFPLYRYLATEVLDFASGCVLHDLLLLYCPMCGGTRAMQALLSFDLVGAFSYNALFIFLVAVFLVLDVIALIRLLRGKERIWCTPTWFWVSLTVLLIGYGVLRNYLMIAHGIDPVGDLGFFWNAITKK